MTEKRFTHRKWCRDRKIFDGDEPFAIVDVYIQAEAICDKLNELHEKKEILEVQLKSATNEIDKLESEIDMLTDTCHDCCKEIREENKELKKQLRREETDKKRLMSYLMRYKGFGFDEIVEDFLDEPYYDNWWEDGFYECCWDEYLKEKGFDGCAEE